jgi:hypothetical protein
MLKIQALRIHRSADLKTINHFMFLFGLSTLDVSTVQYTCEYKTIFYESVHIGIILCYADVSTSVCMRSEVKRQ